jgi:hypothetical protein
LVEKFVRNAKDDRDWKLESRQSENVNRGTCASLSSLCTGPQC